MPKISSKIRQSQEITHAAQRIRLFSPFIRNNEQSKDRCINCGRDHHTRAAHVVLHWHAEHATPSQGGDRSVKA